RRAEPPRFFAATFGEPQFPVWTGDDRRRSTDSPRRDVFSYHYARGAHLEYRADLSACGRQPEVSFWTAGDRVRPDFGRQRVVAGDAGGGDSADHVFVFVEPGREPDVAIGADGELVGDF